MPIALAAVPAAIGLYQTISGGIKANQARKALEKQTPPSYTPSKAISDYYQTALNRYQAGPYNSLQYQTAKKGIGNALATGISTLNSKKLGGNVGALVQQTSNNLENAAAGAEKTQNANLANLGRAAGMKAGDDKYAYGVNAMFPYQQQRQLDVARLSGANQVENAGISNLGSGANSIGQMMLAQKYYGQNNNV